MTQQTITKPAILVVEDHSMVQLGISTVLQQLDTIGNLSIVKTAHEALTLAREHHFHIFIIDIELPDMTGFELVSHLRSINPDAAIIFHTMHEELWVVRQMMTSKADAIVLKSDAATELRTAVECVAAGETYYSTRYEQYIREQDNSGSLSLREQEVLREIASGKSTSEIAEALFVSNNTVEFHRKSIMRKLGARNMAQMVSNAIKQGYLS